MSTLHELRHFIGASQGAAMGAALRGEEGQFFRDKLTEIAEIIEAGAELDLYWTPKSLADVRAGA